MGAVALALFVPFCAAICPASDMEPAKVELSTADSLKLEAINLRFQCEARVNRLEIEKRGGVYNWKSVQPAPIPVSASEPVHLKNIPQ